MAAILQRFATVGELAAGAAARYGEAARAAVAAYGRFCVVLPGGRTPLVLFAALRSTPWVEKAPWRDTHFFWSDERCVPAAHADSNYGLAHRELLSQVPISAGHVHRAPTEIGSPEQAAAAWEHALREFFGACAGTAIFPDFDLVILGVGADGHTASLFPGTSALDVSGRWVAATPPVGTPAVPRLTLTLPVFNHARELLFLAAGPEKRKIVDSAVAGADVPVARIRPRRDPVWLYTEASL